MDVKLNFDVHVQNKISNAIKLLEILYVIMKCYIKLCHSSAGCFINTLQSPY